MKRRDFIRLASLTSPLLLGGCSTLQKYGAHLCSRCINPFKRSEPAEKSDSALSLGNEDYAEVKGMDHLPHQVVTPEQIETLLKDEKARSRYFSQNFPTDIFFEGEKLEKVQDLTKKFRAVQKYVGFGNFNLVGMDEFFQYTKYASGISEISLEEKAFLEEMFHFDAKDYGFNGDKVLHGFTDVVNKREAYKVPYTGHYLMKGDSLDLYEKVKSDVGESLVLTSGVRAMAKQFHLFFEKSLETNGNLSKASRSLAPPGYSYHGQGDFDVGKVGYGLKNFTESFARSDEYKRLLDLGYVNIRYTQDNSLGVRFEPWHIKVKA